MKSKLTKVAFYAAIVELIFFISVIIAMTIGNSLPVDSPLLDFFTIILILFVILVPLGAIFSIIALIIEIKKENKADVPYLLGALIVFLLAGIIFFIILNSWKFAGGFLLELSNIKVFLLNKTLFAFFQIVRN